MRLLIVGFLGVCLSGCGQAQPTLTGGRPVSYWVGAVRDPDAKLRKKAAFKLGNVGPTDAAAFPALLGAVQDADAGVRCEAILALVKFGPAAKEAVPLLTDVQHHDRVAKVRAYAAKALARISSGQ